ncbi:MAG: Peptidase [Firmicutes bacterium]|nr:Peptidase [Bacillota bacterium]
MPGKLWPVFLWLWQCCKRMARHEQQLVYAGVVIVMVAAGLVALISGNSGRSAKMTVEQPAQYEAQTPLTALNQEESPPSQLAVDSKNENIKAEKIQKQANDWPRRPVPGAVKVDYGWQQHPVYKDWRFHTGVDIEAPKGSPVYAVYGGKVITVKKDNSYGLMVMVATGELTVCYGSLGMAAVNPMQGVEAGTLIGTVGEAEGEPYPHLHLALKQNDRYINVNELLDNAR